MPTYTYECACRTHVEQRFIAERNRPHLCVFCACLLKRVPDAPAIAFKGSGFYATDYKGKP